MDPAQSESAAAGGSAQSQPHEDSSPYHFFPTMFLALALVFCMGIALA